jgi:hypothetical protein
MNIRLHIDRLIVDGFDLKRTDGRMVKSAVQAELSRLLTENGLHHELQQGGAVPQVKADTLQVGVNPSPRQLGTQIARSVYGGIGKTK